MVGMAIVTDANEPLHALTVDDYHRMIEVGILTEDDKVELLEGAIFQMSPEGPPHAAVIARLNRWLARGLPDDAQIVRVSAPITLRPHSEPEPDLVVADVGDSTFKTHPERAHLVIEVAKTSRRKDRVRKARIYAQAGLPRYWIVDLVDLCVHVHREPGPVGYASIEAVAPQGLLDPQTCGLPPLDLAALFAAD